MKRQKINYKLEAREQDQKTIVYLYGDIVDEKPTSIWTNDEIEGDFIYPEKVRDLFENISSKEIELHLNSYGGSVFASVSIFNYLKNLDKNITTYVDGIVASGASLIAMAGTKILMAKNTLMMIHRASTFGWGNCNDLRQIADTLEKLDNITVFETYKSRFKGDDKKLIELIDKETWLSADECYNLGLCDEVLQLKEEVKEESKQAVKEEEVKNISKFMKNFANLKMEEF